MKLKTIDSAKFSKAPRGNALVEVARLACLLVMIVNHWNLAANVSLLGHSFEPFGEWVSIYPFIVITGIFTVGKGKDYFLRNLSRLIFVIVITSVIAIPIFKTIYNDNLTQRHWTLDMILFGGRDVWYLYGVLLASVFLPLVKIDHPISKYKLAFFFAGILLSATAMLPYRQTFLAPLQLFCMGVASYIFHKLIFCYN